MRFFMLLAMFLAVPVSAAHASAAMSCLVKVDVLSSVKDGDIYRTRVKILESKLGTNTSDKSECFSAGMLPERDITIPNKLEAHNIIWLRYNEYSGLGPNGPVSTQEWSLPSN